MFRHRKHQEPVKPAEKIAPRRKPAQLTGGRQAVLPGYFSEIPGMFTPRRARTAPPLASDVTKSLPTQGGVTYATGGAWVSANGAAEPGIAANEVRWTSNPVPGLNPVLEPNAIEPVLGGLL